MEEQSYIFCSLIKHFLQREKYISDMVKSISLSMRKHIFANKKGKLFARKEISLYLCSKIIERDGRS